MEECIDFFEKFSASDIDLSTESMTDKEKDFFGSLFEKRHNYLVSFYQKQ